MALGMPRWYGGRLINAGLPREESGMSSIVSVWPRRESMWRKGWSAGGEGKTCHEVQGAPASVLHSGTSVGRCAHIGILTCVVSCLGYQSYIWFDKQSTLNV